MNLSNAGEKTVVITDTSCIIILQKLSLLGILHQLFASVFTTPEIAAEYGDVLPGWINIIAVKNTSFQFELSSLVDPGEASAIALAHEIENKFLITDDLQARKLAIKLGLSVIGTLGVLIRAKETGLISHIKPVLEQMKLTDFRVSDDLFKAVLAKAGEQ